MEFNFQDVFYSTHCDYSDLSAQAPAEAPLGGPSEDSLLRVNKLKIAECGFATENLPLEQNLKLWIQALGKFGLE